MAECSLCGEKDCVTLGVVSSDDAQHSQERNARHWRLAYEREKARLDESINNNRVLIGDKNREVTANEELRNRLFHLAQGWREGGWKAQAEILESIVRLSDQGEPLVKILAEERDAEKARCNLARKWAKEYRANWVAEEARRIKLEDAIRLHRDQRGDDRCWLDDLALYLVLDGDPIPTIDSMALPPKEEFLSNCARYWQCRQPPGAKYQTTLADLRADLLHEVEAWERNAQAWVGKSADRVEVYSTVAGIVRIVLSRFDKQGDTDGKKGE